MADRLPGAAGSRGEGKVGMHRETPLRFHILLEGVLHSLLACVEVVCDADA